MAKKYWLMKTEPTTFSFEDLIKAPKKTTHWEGVRNFQARNLLRDSIKIGDVVFIYHSNVDEPAVMGVAEVVKEGYPDDSALNPKSEYYDESAKKKGISPWYMVDVKATHAFESPVTREQMKKEAALSNIMVLKKGARLSVQPVGEKEFHHILKLGKPKPV
jgi:predicted RNA-binding protein with PUA-like domain